VNTFTLEGWVSLWQFGLSVCDVRDSLDVPSQLISVGSLIPASHDGHNGTALLFAYFSSELLQLG
jgi:hypothetical protein